MHVLCASRRRRQKKRGRTEKSTPPPTCLIGQPHINSPPTSLSLAITHPVHLPQLAPAPSTEEREKIRQSREDFSLPKVTHLTPSTPFAIRNYPQPLSASLASHTPPYTHFAQVLPTVQRRAERESRKTEKKKKYRERVRERDGEGE